MWVSGPAISGSIENLIETQIIRPPPRSAESETLTWKTALTGPAGDSDVP